MRLALAVALLLLAPAAAHAEWTGQTLSHPHAFVDDPGVIVSGNGAALAAWRFQDGLGNRGRSGLEGATRAPGASGFGARLGIVRPSPNVRPGAIAAGLEPYGRSGAILALRLPGAADTPAARLGVRFGSTSGRFGRIRTIRRAGPHSIPRASLATNARGDAALAWFEDRGVRTDRVYVALRRAGHGFGTPRRLATGRIRGVAAAIGERGDVLVSWDARGVLRTRFKPRGSKGFRATDTIRSKPAFFADMHPVVTPSGRAVLAWSAQFLSEGGGSGPVRFQAAVRPAGARRFARARLLETIPVRDYDGLGRTIDALADSAGVVAIAWRGASGVRVQRGAGPVQTVSPAGSTAVLSDLAAGPDGRLLAVWDTGVDDPAALVRAALADGVGAPFGAPEDVSAAGRDSHFGHAAFLGPRPLVVLASRPAGGGERVAQAYVR
jgi:hypothetical protein